MGNYLIYYLGMCAVIECEFIESLGAGALVTNVNSDPGTSPLLYMVRSKVHNCDFGGIEARSGGNLVVKDCQVYDNRQGILIWSPHPEDVMKVIIQECEIFNNSREGVFASDHFNYKNNVSVTLEGCKIHHNQIGVSLAFYKEFYLNSNSIFSNGSWGIFLR